MIPTVVDSSAWRRFFRGTDQDVVLLLLQRNRAFLHPWVEGELLLGSTSKKATQSLAALPRTRIAPTRRQVEFIQERNLSGRRVGWVDTQLLLVASLCEYGIATADQWLARQAVRLEIPVQIIP